MLINRKVFTLLNLILFTLLFVGCSKKIEQKPEVKKPNQFALPVADLIEVIDTIQVNQTLSDILTPHSVTQKRINEIEKTAKEVFPVRSFRAGDHLYVYAKWDSVETVKYLVYTYKNDPVNYVVFDVRDTLKIYKKQKPSVIKEVVASGTIKNSLWQTLQEKNISQQLAADMEDIYNCQIDFFSIQPNDSFKVVYQQISVDGVPAGSGKILAADFIHRKENYYAIYFHDGKESGYYDEKGNSLKRMFLKAPLKFFSISSKFSMNRYHPILHVNKAHLGTDYAAPIGTPIMTVGTGVVLEAAYSSGNGNYVKIKHNATYTTQYLHMSRFAKGIRKGASVMQGQVIGYVGSTGLATGPHVCFRFWKNGVQVNPLTQKYQSANPISKDKKQAFELVKKDELNKLFM
jgi:murein DD-endopeptidase MepM/ murein hydrolase activator NlpD